MNRGQVLAVDFEKRELKDTQQNSDNDKQSFYRNKTKICNDAVTIFQTAKSGGVWHMRAYVGDADKYFQKSLRTKDKASAIDKAEEYERILSSATLVVENRLKEASTSAYTQDVDDMIDEEMRRQKTDFVRTSMKKSIRTYTYKLLNKAEANIEAVGKGTFGVGIYPNKTKIPAAKKV